MTLGDQLRLHRKQAKLTQKELGRLIGYHDSVVSRVENNRQLPTRQYLQCFIQALSLPRSEQRLIMQAFRRAPLTIANKPEPQTNWPESEVDWGEEARAVALLYGREQELRQLTRWIRKDGCRLVMIKGMGGIGKTALAAATAVALQPYFARIIWRSLQNAPPLAELLLDILPAISPPEEITHATDVGRLQRHCIQYLSSQRCLFVLDNLESILASPQNAGAFKEGFEGYEQLIRLIATREHQSCLLLTGREEPQALSLLAETAAPVRSLRLRGLPAAAGQRILADRGVVGADEEIVELNAHYSGNPLALKVVAELIREIYAGNVAAYVESGMPLFGTIEDVLEEQWQRLSALEQSILFWLAIEREPVTLATLQANITGPTTPAAVMVALHALKQRSLVESVGKQTFSLQNVVMEYVTERLIRRVFAEITAGEISLLQSHALLKAEARQYIQQIQVNLILKPLIGQLRSFFKNDQDILDRLQQIVLSLQSGSAARAGYGGGNILNLMSQMGHELAGVDFSHLAIWQANLQTANLQNANFAHADLSGSLFSQSFDKVFSVAFSHDGQLMATSGNTGEIQLWHPSTGRNLRNCAGHSNNVWSVVYHPHSAIIASGSDDKTVRLWDSQSGHCLRILAGHTDFVRSITFGPDGNLLASASYDSAVRIWDAQTGKCLRILKKHQGIARVVCFSPSGLLASGGFDGNVHFWDTASGACLKTIVTSSRVTDAAFNHDGRLLATAHADYTVKVWDSETCQLVQTLSGHTRAVQSVAFHPERPLLASSSRDHAIRLWNIATGHCLKTSAIHTNAVWEVAYNSDGRLLASVSDDRTIRLWNGQSLRLLQTIEGYTNWLVAISHSPVGQHFASAGDDGIVRLWHTGKGRYKRELKGHTNWVGAVAFHPDGELLASGGADSIIRLWDIISGQCVGELQGHTDGIFSLCFGADGSVIASCGIDRTVRLWHAHTGQQLHTLPTQSTVRSVAISPDNKIVASGHEDRKIRLWDLETGRQRAVLMGHEKWVFSVAFHPERSNLLASSSADQSVRLWNIESGQCINVLRRHKGWIWTLAFSHDGQLLGSAGTDNAIRIWNPSTGRCLQVLTGHTKPVRCIDFSANDQTLVSCSEDESIKVWQLSTGQFIETIHIDRPYEGLNITGVTGFMPDQKEALLRLGAVQENIGRRSHP